MKSNQNAAPGTCWRVESLRHTFDPAQRLLRGPPGRAGHEPPSSSPSSRQWDPKLCFVFQTPLTTATMAQNITQVRCHYDRSEGHGPSSGRAPWLPAHHPGAPGTAAVPQNNPPPSADGLPLPGGVPGAAASRVPELPSRGAGGRQGSPEALPHRPRRGGIAGFPELPERERGECALRGAMPFAPRPGRPQPLQGAGLAFPYPVRRSVGPRWVEQGVRSTWQVAAHGWAHHVPLLKSEAGPLAHSDPAPSFPCAGHVCWAPP